MPETGARFVDYYELLGVAVTTSADDIKKAIKDKRRKTNPRQNHPDPMMRSVAEQTMRDLDLAERVLLDRSARQAYDAERPARLAEATSTTSAVGPVDADWADRAQYFLDNENPAAAHRVAVEAVTQAPGDPRAWALRGQSSALLGSFPDAEYELSEASRLDQSAPFPIYLLGEVYAAQEKWKSALTQYDRALQLDPENPIFGTSKAKLFLDNDQPKAALKIMEPIVKRFPGQDVYTYHLAMAIYAVAIGALPSLPNGSSIWTSEEQIVGLERAATRMSGLGNRDRDITEAVTALRKFAAEGREVRWDTAAPNLYVGLGFLVFMLSCAGCYNTTNSLAAGFFIGLIIAAGVAGGIFTAVRRKPAWQLAAQALGKGNLTQQMQDVGNRIGLGFGRYMR